MERIDSIARPWRRSDGGFSLIELFAVVVIISMLLALTVPALRSLMESHSLTTAGQLLVSHIELARQTASSYGQTVQVRLVRLDSDTSSYNGIQAGRVDLLNTWIPLGRVVRFPQNIVISSDTTKLSPLLGAPNLLSGVMNVPGFSNAPYVAFNIRPSGIVEPAFDEMNSCFLAMVPAHADKPGITPANRLFIQINPLTGNTSVYHP